MTSAEEWPGRLVLEDVITHPDSSISEVHQRTGFGQSHVSASVARLNERGLLVTAADPGDARRTWIGGGRGHVGRDHPPRGPQG